MNRDHFFCKFGCVENKHKYLSLANILCSLYCNKSREKCRYQYGRIGSQNLFSKFLLKKIYTELLRTSYKVNYLKMVKKLVLAKNMLFSINLLFFFSITCSCACLKINPAKVSLSKATSLGDKDNLLAIENVLIILDTLILVLVSMFS